MIHQQSKQGKGDSEIKKYFVMFFLVLVIVFGLLTSYGNHNILTASETYNNYIYTDQSHLLYNMYLNR